MQARSMSCRACGDMLPEAVAEPESEFVLVGHDRQHGVPGAHAIHICPRCGLGETRPRVRDSEFHDFYPQEYVPHERPSFPMRLLMMPFMYGRHRVVPFDRLHKQKAGRLLDIGCGRGDLGEHFSKRGWSVAGVDISADACAVAQARGVDVQVGTMATVSLAEESFDIVVFRHTLEHVNDPVSDLQAAYRALRPGGEVLVTLPNFSSWQRRFFGSYWFCLELPRHRFHFSPYSLHLMLEQAGFEVERTPTSTSALGLPASVQYRLFGSCVFQSGWKLLLGYLIAVGLYPLTRLLDTLAGHGDFLHATGRKSSSGASNCSYPA